MKGVLVLSVLFPVVLQAQEIALEGDIDFVDANLRTLISQAPESLPNSIPEAVLPKESSRWKRWDLFGGITYSPFYQGMTGRIWETVEALAIVSGPGSSSKTDSSMAIGGFMGAGFVFSQSDTMRASFGGEYELSYFMTNSTFTYGAPKAAASAPPVGSQEHLALTGLDHKLSSYIKVSFPIKNFLPIAVQFNAGLSFVHLLSMKLEDWTGATYKINAGQSLGLHPSVRGGSGILPPFPFPYDHFYDFSFRNTTQLSFVAGMKVYVGPIFLGADYTTNVVLNSLRIQTGLSLNSDFFKNSW